MPEPTAGQSKEPFVGQQDRPEVGLNPDDPITSLRVRDLVALLGAGTKSAVLDAVVPKGAIKDLVDYPPKGIAKEFHDAKQAKDGKDAKDYVDAHTVPLGRYGVDPDPGLRQAVDALVREVAQLREEVRQLRR
jgi:hypothetical protein